MRVSAAAAAIFMVIVIDFNRVHSAGFQVAGSWWRWWSGQTADNGRTEGRSDDVALTRGSTKATWKFNAASLINSHQLLSTLERTAISWNCTPTLLWADSG